MNDLARRFTQTTGSSYYLTADNPTDIDIYLHRAGVLPKEESVRTVTSAGAGNMNVALRVTTDERSLIVKQSRPWVAKFPDLEAPAERVLIERAFYRAIEHDGTLRRHVPELYHTDTDNFVLVMEDLGRVGDLSSIYAGDRDISEESLTELLTFASVLHRLPATDFPDNAALRRLNHAHIFDLPFREDNGFPLEDMFAGLGELARPFQRDERLRWVALELGEIYLGHGGGSLIHGDYYPGSFLAGRERVYVIDAEFAFRGRPEFDVGVLMAHLLMSRTEEARLAQIDRDYDRPPGFDNGLARRFCYVEIIRRIIGIAQLPLSLSIQERRHLLEQARAGLV